ncbi:hypothetical protein B0H63DRAFT_304246 [Podospora didyma]|uniref:Uncharacterized protein n=1 Tax=Podospora didyma TaxID=330526 RepID=A0AAE0N4G9_9PEZI|nr:hypothetical protein B0H63DRAFT_304246 [Podospora didyma]
MVTYPPSLFQFASGILNFPTHDSWWQSRSFDLGPQKRFNVRTTGVYLAMLEDKPFTRRSQDSAAAGAQRVVDCEMFFTLSIVTNMATSAGTGNKNNNDNNNEPASSSSSKPSDTFLLFGYTIPPPRPKTEKRSWGDGSDNHRLLDGRLHALLHEQMLSICKLERDGIDLFRPDMNRMFPIHSNGSDQGPVKIGCCDMGHPSYAELRLAHTDFALLGGQRRH